MADYVQPSDPAVADPTKASLPASQNEALSNLNARLGTVESGELINRSFEAEGDDATEAAGWTQTEGAGGTISRVDTENYHGEWSMKFNRVAGGGNNAGDILSDPFTFAEFTELILGGYYQADAALASKIEAQFFDEDLVSVGSVVLAAATTIQTLWTPFTVSGDSVGGTRFAKLLIAGATADVDVAGNAYFDGLSLEAIDPNAFIATGNFNTTNTSFVTATTAKVWIPTGAATAAITVQHRQTAGGETAEYRARIGGNNGTTQTASSTSFVSKTSVITIGSEEGYQTVTIEHRRIGAIGSSDMNVVASGDLTEENIAVN